MNDYNDLITLIRDIEEAEELLGTLNDSLQEKLASIPVGTYFQDEITSLVYKVVKPSGKFVYFKDLDYTRTAKPGERSGSLSKKEATEAGFELPKG